MEVQKFISSPTGIAIGTFFVVVLIVAVVLLVMALLKQRRAVKVLEDAHIYDKTVPTVYNAKYGSARLAEEAGRPDATSGGLHLVTMRENSRTDAAKAFLTDEDCRQIDCAVARRLRNSGALREFDCIFRLANGDTGIIMPGSAGFQFDEFMTFLVDRLRIDDFGPDHDFRIRPFVAVVMFQQGNDAEAMIAAATAELDRQEKDWKPENEELFRPTSMQVSAV